MVATVIVGKERDGAGVTARIFNLGDEDDAQAGELFRSREVRHQVASTWALLPSPVIPAHAGEKVFKLSRQSLVGGASWTWLGCYKSAQFHDNPRGGTYIGCGVLSRDATFNSNDTLKYLLPLLEQLEIDVTGSGRVFRPVVDVRESAIGVQPGDWPSFAVPPDDGGLSVNEGRKLYIDLAEEGEQLNATLFEFLDRAQRDGAFGPYSELVLSNAGRMAKTAKSSRAYDVYSPSQWAGGPGRDQPPAAAPPVREADVALPAWAARQAESDVPDQGILSGLRADMRRVEAKVDGIDLAVVQLKGTLINRPAAGPHWRASAIAGFAAAGLATIGCIYLALIQPRDRASDSLTSSRPSTHIAAAEPSPSPSPNGDDCEPVTLSGGPIVEQDRDRLRAEKACLDQEVGRRRERLRQVENAVAQGSGVSTATGAP